MNKKNLTIRAMIYGGAFLALTSLASYITESGSIRGLEKENKYLLANNYVSASFNLQNPQEANFNNKSRISEIKEQIASKKDTKEYCRRAFGMSYAIFLTGLIIDYNRRKNECKLVHSV